jgi:hypothetical protein
LGIEVYSQKKETFLQNMEKSYIKQLEVENSAYWHWRKLMPSVGIILGVFGLGFLLNTGIDIVIVCAVYKDW